MLLLIADVIILFKYFVLIVTCLTIFFQKEQMVFEQKAKDYDRDLQIIRRAIEEKLKLHDRLNKQLAKLIEAAGGSENDPIQLKVRAA